MKRLIVTLAAAAMTCSAIFAQNRGDMYVGGILGVSGGSSKTSVTVARQPWKVTPRHQTQNLIWQENSDISLPTLESKLWARLRTAVIPYRQKDGKWLKDNTNIFAIGPSIATTST